MKNFSLSQKFRASVPIHIYQHSADWGVLFYDDVYILAHFIKMCCLAEKYKIKIFSICYMLNHIHYLLASESLKNLRLFMQTLTSSFALEYNEYTGHHGSVFATPFGFAFKSKTKAFRTCLNYIANNAPEKRIVRKAVDYKWNFLRYSQTPHPYSNPIMKKNCSKELWELSKEIKSLHSQNKAVKSRRLVCIKNMLDKREWLQFVDLAISIYNVIDYNASAAAFDGGLDSMLIAPDYNTGAEYEINEDSLNYIPFYQYLTLLSGRMKLCNFSPYALNEKQRKNLVKEMNSRIRCSIKHMSLFFHLDENEILELICS